MSASSQGPAVSVVMNCRNGERYLREALDSVYAQTFTDWEIVFVDNASTDSTPAIVAEYDARIRYVRNAESVTLGAARNIALSHCSGRFIAFLDADDIWDSNKLALQIPKFDDPSVGLVYSDCWMAREGGNRWRQFRGDRAYPAGDAAPRLLADYSLVLSTAVIRSATLARLDHWFDPAFRMIEEADVFIRIALISALAYVPEPLATYRIHAGSESAQRTELYGTENIQFREKITRSHPEFVAAHLAEFEHWTNNGRWSAAVASWKRGDGRDARRIIGSMTDRSSRHTVLFLASFLPFAWMAAVRSAGQRFR